MTSAPGRRPPEIRILCLGDSYTIGESVAETDRWPVKLAALLQARGIPAAAPTIIAKTGWTTDELNAAIDAQKPAGVFGLVTLLIGVNNQYRGRPSEEYRLQFRSLLDRAIAFADGDVSRTLVVSIPDWSVTTFARRSGRDVARIAAEIDTVTSIARSEASRAGAQFVDVSGASRRALSEMTLTASDGLHPSAVMYEEWSQLILPVAVAALSGRDRQ